MNPSIRLGRIRGIQIGANWSLLVVFALLVWSLANGIFPSENAGLSNTSYYAMAAAAATLFFASILAHELGHAFVAQREGMVIEGITLWLFGGIARFRGEFPSAWAEFRIAIAGPAVSLLIGLSCVGIAQTGLPGAVHGVASWLGYINLVLLVFNLLPALPLDGGRVLRSLLWRAKSDYVWATRVAARVGQGIGALMAGAGIVLAVTQGAFGGAWFAFIGWFLFNAAGEEYRAAGRRAAFGDTRVGDVMVRDPIVVDPSTPVGQLVDAMTDDLRHATYPVVDHHRAVGLLPLGRLVETPRGQWAGRRVSDFTLPLTSVPVLRSDTPLAEAAARLGNGGLGRGLVLDGDRLVGLLSMSDVVRALERQPVVSAP